MASKPKKNFLNALEEGETRDQTMRQKTLSRFDKVETAMEGRSSLLETPTKPVAPAANAGEGDQSFYVETLVKEGRATRRLARLQISKIDDNPLNSRKFYDEEKVKARAASIAADGQLVPAFAAPNPDEPDRYTLIDGHYRKRANLHLSHHEMDCWVLEGLSPVDFYKLARTLNNEREQETFLDVAFSYRQLLDAGIARTEEELVPIVGESKAKINKLLAVVDLPQSVIDVIAAHPEAFGYNIGYELTLYNKVAGADKAADLAERVAAEQLSFAKVESIRKKAQEGKKGTRQTSRQYKLARGGVELGTLKEWDTGRVTLDLTLTDPAKREALLSNLKAHLDVDSE
ncbi:ParB/RepB/Spo0J family partition protein [Cupriavidus basilensis]|uniref:ParB/RepB/Spo0J family partition protein n=1 Tax=Cupriavidus basilensis TaxID=68895 RepID=UPI0039F72A7B